MIPVPHITAWRAVAPWSDDALVEQDLILSRALVEIFQDPALAAELAFRGGTALHKLHLAPGARYSEDLDLVQIRPGPIGPLLDGLRRVLDPWLGTPKRDFHEGRIVLLYRFTSEIPPQRRMRLKVEINSREHFHVLSLPRPAFTVTSDWYAGSADITTFELDELLGTKLRALYQRKKGRDLFDLAVALDRGAQPGRIVDCFQHYMRAGGHTVSRAQFEENLELKRRLDVFRTDMAPLLRPSTVWDPTTALDRILTAVIARLPGEPWAGDAP